MVGLRVVAVASSIFFAMNCSVCAAECKPSDFMDYEKVIWNEQLKISFVLTATREQYEKVRKSWAAGGGYGLFYGSLSYDEARNAASKEALSRKFSSDYSSHLDYLSQRLGEKGAASYEACIRENNKGPGLRLWVSDRKDPAITVTGFWIGQDSGQGIGQLKNFSIRGGELVAPPAKRWTKGDPEHVIIVKEPTATALFALEVGGKQNSIALVGDKLDPVKTPIASPKGAIKISSGGTSDGNSPFCRRRTVSDCVHPSSGARLEVGSGHLEQKYTNGTGWAGPSGPVPANSNSGWDVTTNTPEAICIELWANTGACQTEITMQGQVAANEIKPATSAGAQTNQPQPVKNKRKK